MKELSENSARILDEDVLSPVRIRSAATRYFGDDFPDRRDTRVEIKTRARHQKDVAVGMNAAAEVERRTGVELHVIVVKDAELEDRHEVVEKVAPQLDLNP